MANKNKIYLEEQKSSPAMTVAIMKISLEEQKLSPAMTVTIIKISLEEQKSSPAMTVTIIWSSTILHLHRGPTLTQTWQDTSRTENQS